MHLRQGVAVAAMGVFATAAGQASAQEHWDMALAYSATNYHSEIAAEFAAQVTEASGGALEVVTHPSGSLFSGDEIYGAVRRGLVPIGERLISALSNDDPFFGLDSVPFLASSFEDARRLYDVSRDALAERLAEDDLVFLYSCPWPPQGFYSTVPADTPEALQGQAFRAYNATTSRFAELLGMQPTTIEAAELSQAFATGVADSMISSGATGYDRALWEHVDYYYDVKAWLPRNMVFVNGGAWEALSPELQEVITTAAADAEDACWARAEELDSWYVEQFVEHGMTVGDLNPEMQALFEEVGATLRDEWLETAGERGQAAVAAYLAE
ncbi:MAG: TRAP transporter substrate-binding protein [Rhodospirillaceae bacterium]|nr:TRAP transporter substrate-binding protein [Rhodospirillaceae bacterium]